MEGVVAVTIAGRMTRFNYLLYTNLMFSPPLNSALLLRHLLRLSCLWVDTQWNVKLQVCTERVHWSNHGKVVDTVRKTGTLRTHYLDKKYRSGIWKGLEGTGGVGGVERKDGYYVNTTILVCEVLKSIKLKIIETKHFSSVNRTKLFSFVRVESSW